MLKNKIPFFPIYLTSFLFSFHIALPLYINSSFLGQFLPESAIGLIYTISSVVIILFLTQFPKVLSRFGNYKTIIGVLVFQMALLALLASPLSPLFLIPIFIFIQAFAMLGIFNIDVFLERFSTDTTTGFTRGTLLTIVNLAVLLGPLTAGIILSDGNFSKIYLIAAIFLIPALYIVVQKLHAFKDPAYHITPYIQTVRSILFAKHPNDEIRHVIIANLLLRFFYAWMIIYTPLYLHAHIGFEWEQIGVIFAIMLLPFVLFEIPMGKLSDTRVGEKKIMIGGFIIMSLFTALLFFITEPTLVVWAALLFGTRIGASFVEITSESYFFKHISSADTEVLSIFRDAQPLAYIVAPLIASFLLIFVDIQYLFLILALVMLSGLWVAGNMKQNSPVDRATSL